MAASKMSSSSTTLHTLLGAPDEDTREATGNHGVAQIMRIDLPRETVVEMQRYSKAGKPMQLTFGKNPMLRFGNTTRSLRVAPSTFRDEVYRLGGKDETDAHFMGLVTHSIGLESANEVTAGADEALNKLKASMASWESEKKNNQTTLVDTKVKAGSRPSIGNANNKRTSALLRRPHLSSSATQSLPSSPPIAPSMPDPTKPPPSLTAVSDIAKSRAKPAHKLDEGFVDQQKLLRIKRRAMVHLLAVEPISEDEIVKLTGIPADECHALLEKAGKRVDELWGLSDKYYKELNVYDFGYSAEQLEKAVENAIRAYDRQRLQPDDELWQTLLPPDKRGTGICLSKLNLGQSFMNSNHRSLLANAGEGGSSLPRSRSQEPAARKKPSQKEQQTRRLLSTKPGKPTSTAKSTPKTDDESHKPPKESKAGEKRKQPPSNPKIKSAEFVHESDEEALSDLNDAGASQRDAKRIKDNDGNNVKKAANARPPIKAQPSKSKPEGTTKALPNVTTKVPTERKPASSTDTKDPIRPRADSSKLSKPSMDSSKSASQSSPASQKPKSYSNDYSSLTPARKSNLHRPTSSTSSMTSPNIHRPSKRPSMDYPTASSSNDESTPNAKRQKTTTNQSPKQEGPGTATPPLSQPSSSSSPPSKPSISSPANGTIGTMAHTNSSPSPSSLDILRAENASAWTKYYAIQYAVATSGPSPLPPALRNNLLAAYATAEALCKAVRARTLEMAVDSGAHESVFDAQRAELATRKRPQFWQGPEDWRRWLPAPGAELPAGLPEVMRPEMARFGAKFNAMMEKAETVERPAGANDDSLFGRGYDPKRAGAKNGDSGAAKQTLTSGSGSDSGSHLQVDGKVKRKWEDLTEDEQREDAANRKILWDLDDKMAQGAALIAEAEYQQKERQRKTGKA